VVWRPALARFKVLKTKKHYLYFIYHSLAVMKFVLQ
jgi:hypothetical protein